MGAVGATEPDCTREGRFPNPEECGSFYECLQSQSGGYDLIKENCNGFLFNNVSQTCSSEKCATRERRSVMTPYHAYSHLCEEKVNGFVCADCRSLVQCVKGQAFVRRCTADRFCDMREDFGGGICYPKSPLQCTCLEAHTFFRDYYDSQKFFSCSGVGSSPTSYRCPDGMFFSEETSQCLNKVGLPPCTVTGIFANPKNCTEYYSCIALRHGWLQKSFACLNSSLYNERTGICEDPCPQAVCTKEGRFPDPLDKSCYYECFRDGEEMKSIRYQCPEGNMWYEGQSGHCVLETEIEVPSPFAKCESQLSMCKDDILVVEPPVEDGCGSKPCYPGVPCEESFTYPFYICGPCPTGYIEDGVTCQPPKFQCPYRMTGDGMSCGLDTDEDGFPDEELNCSYVKCRRDNCKELYNPDQHDLDFDGIGDKCDSDLDGDGVENMEDNCPYIWNADQADQENDGVGDLCDNCPIMPNPGQEDGDQDFIGNVCDNNIDSDRDGVQDNLDNCPTAPNADQSDADMDEIGDVCDTDADGDGTPNTEDNCVLVFNPDQKITSSEVFGDACIEDLDGDFMPNMKDHCPSNPNVQKLTWRNPTIVNLKPDDPGSWEISEEMVTQKKNAAGSMVVGENILGGLDFTGDFRVENPWRNYIGLVFSYQNNGKFYIFMWKNETTDDLTRRGVQLKVVDSTTGPSQLLNDAVWRRGDTENQTRLIWKEDMKAATNLTYKFLVQHRPIKSLIRVVIYQGDLLVLDSGNMRDDTLKGGRVGVFSHSQMGVMFSNFKLICNDGPTRNSNITLPLLPALSADDDGTSYTELESGLPIQDTFSDADPMPNSEIDGGGIPRIPEEESEDSSILREISEAVSWGLKRGNADRVLYELKNIDKDKLKRILEVITWMLYPGNTERVILELAKLPHETFDTILSLDVWMMDPANANWLLTKLQNFDEEAIIKIEEVASKKMEPPLDTQQGHHFRNLDNVLASVKDGVMEKTRKLEEGGTTKVGGGKIFVGTFFDKHDSSYDEEESGNPVGKPETGNLPSKPHTLRKTSKWG